MNIINNKNINRLRLKLASQSKWFGKAYQNSNHPNLLSRIDTLKMIANNDISISRFGDGELLIALFERGILFQKKNRELGHQLKKILLEKDDRVLVCINNEFMRSEQIFWILQYERSLKNYSACESLKEANDIGILSRKKEWIFYNCCNKILFGRKSPSLFGDATLFMLGLYYDQYREENTEIVMEHFRNLFRKKRLLIVAPESPLMSPSFRSLKQQLIAGGTKSINYIDIPETNAFMYYHDIKSKILESKGFDAIWVQAGPTASILTHDLAINHNMLAYDIGSFNTTLKFIL